MAEAIKKMTRKEKIAAGVEKKPKRKKAYAERLKSERQGVTQVVLSNYPTSPRKMRLVVDQIRGMEVEKALAVLSLTERVGAEPVRKLLLNAMESWDQKNPGQRADAAGLVVSAVYVDSARQLKRFRPAPQGRAHRIRKRSNHVTLVLGTKEVAK
jgi:large subunit ribosomal protein L22